MSRDPFEEMQRRNPVTSDELPVAPMSVAERILGRKAGRAMPGWALATAAAFLVAAVGGGTLLFLRGGDAVPVGSGGTTTTVTPDDEGSTTSVVVDFDYQASVYFLAENASEGWQGGPFLIPAVRMIDSADLVGDAVNLLLVGPNSDEAAAHPSLASAIPDGTRLLDSSLVQGVATVNLSSEFQTGGGSFSMGARVAQVIATLTSLDGVDSVRFEIEGVPTTVFGGEGVTVPDPAGRAEVEAFLPAVMIESPAWGADGGNPLVAQGTANVFEATVSVELLDASGAVIFEGFTTATCGTGCRGMWEIEVPYQVEGGQYGTLRAFEASAEDGRPINVREHKVWLYATEHPGDSTTTSIVENSCSGNVEGDLVDQPGLPESVAEKRAAIWSAAVACDWDGLQSLLGSPFSYSFGGQDDSIDAPIRHWQDLEDQGEQPMLYLVELFNQPFGTISNEGVTYYVWPSVHTKPWDEVTAAERAELLRLYDDAALAEFEGFGAYFGYRVGITDDGEWVYFIAGD